MPTASGLLTYEDALRRPEDRFEEIVAGEPRLMPPPSKGHAILIGNLWQMLTAQIPTAVAMVTAAGAGLGIRKTPVLSYRIPDLMVIPKQAPDSDPYFVWDPPMLVAECLSPSNRKGNPEELLADYQSIRAAEIWFFAPQESKLTRWQRERAEPLVDTGSATVNLFMFPEVEVDLGRLWDAFRLL